MSDRLQILAGDCRETLKSLADESVQTCVTSPPYFNLRSYLDSGHADKSKEIGSEKTPDEYVATLVGVFREVRRALKKDGTAWINLGDSYAGGGNGGGGSFAQDGIRCALPGTDKNKAFRIGRRGAYGGIKPKDLIGIPWMVAFALRADGWWLRQDIIWSKPAPMPESVTDRCTKAHEYIFLLSKCPTYYFDAAAIAEKSAYPSDGIRVATPKNIEGLGLKPTRAYGEQARNGRRNSFARNGKDSNGCHGQKAQHRVDRELINYVETRNKRSVWTVPSAPFKEAHFATFPPDLIRPCVRAGSRPGHTILDPFGGSFTTAQVAIEEGRRAIMCELNSDYIEIGKRRCEVTPGLAL
jgi:DNA modification methylase